MNHNFDKRLGTVTRQFSDEELKDGLRSIFKIHSRKIPPMIRSVRKKYGKYKKPRQSK